ncbi:divalent-cation tolerance protein CutA [Cognatilysobacter bugurensis]|uniref:Divalent cation tolerance protein n=1 Tax=Cognatilysobacter bugurensis TaxID=543356 RepID=A0A918T057_9GAMM|nr:divalent-cation tolerance protein CutA [Lysobacter bugurensis]GHA80879.1 divalent cation tolerance protein [Lysobacter bugurensis]
MPALIVYCSCPDAATADAIATALVDERLAACVTALPNARSTYRWEGRVEHSDELLLLIKTASERLDALIDRIRALHPYELPEVIAVEAVGGLAPYLRWVAEQSGVDA